jgi:hypothetical protein
MKPIKEELKSISLNYIINIYCQFSLNHCKLFQGKKNQILIMIIFAHNIVVVYFFKFRYLSLILVKLDNQSLLFTHETLLYLAEIFILLLPFDCGENCFENWLGKVFKF